VRRFEIRKIAEAVAHREVCFVAMQVDGLPLRADDQVDVRMTRAERRQPPHQPARREGRQHREREPPGEAGLVHLQGSAGQPVEAIGDAGEVSPPRLRQLHPARQAPEQRTAKAFLQSLDVLADGAGGDAELSRRLDEVAVAGRGFEGAESGQGRQGSHAEPQFC
jgi:hypothetical protein